MPAPFDSPATDNIKPVSDPGGSARAELPNLPGKTPGIINPYSCYHGLDPVKPQPMDGPGEYNFNVNIEPSVNGPGHGTLDSPASGNPVKKG